MSPVTIRVRDDMENGSWLESVFLLIGKTSNYKWTHITDVTFLYHWLTSELSVWTLVTSTHLLHWKHSNLAGFHVYNIDINSHTFGDLDAVYQIDIIIIWLQGRFWRRWIWRYKEWDIGATERFQWIFKSYEGWKPESCGWFEQHAVGKAIYKLYLKHRKYNFQH